ncbi:hypothetical protein L6R52_15100 [Myxococcota bacterium]|nr:hypothetical protein [Myxococcota bacterium]
MTTVDGEARAHPIVGALALVLLLVSGVFGAGFWITRDRGPGADAFPKATDVVRAGHREGDLVFLVPSYATRARESLGAELPALAVRDPLAEDLAVHPRVWVIGLFGEGVALRERMTAAGLKIIDMKEPAPGITVDLWETPAKERVVYAFRDELRRAKVWHEKDGQRTMCSTWTEKNGQNGPYGRWACPYDADWFYVAPQWHRMGEEMRLCLWAHPPSQGRLVIAFPDVPMTGQLFGRGGHTDNATRNARAAVDLDVEVGQEPPQRFTFALEETFRPFVLTTPATGTATVTFAVSSADAGANHFCFVADVRAPR